MLQEAGFKVLDGRTAEAVQLTRQHRPALVLLDSVLPYDDGADILQELNHPALESVFVVLLFGSPADLGALGKSAAANSPGGYIKRPFSKPELQAQVEAFLRIRASQEA